MIRLRPPGYLTREEFLTRHQRVTRVQTFVLGLAAGIALTVIIFSIGRALLLQRPNQTSTGGAATPSHQTKS